MINRSNQFTLRVAPIFITLFSVVGLIMAGCGSGDGTGEFAAASRGDCNSNKTCPTADAGPDQTIILGSKVTLDGSRSSSGTTGLISYQWTLTSQPRRSTATLAGVTTVRPSFTPDVAGDYSIKLVVDNGGLLSKPDSVTITAEIGNLPPIADAGPDSTVAPGAIITLNGSDSHDPNGSAITYAWTFKKQPPKSQSSLNNPTSATPSFTADVQGKYKLTLVVSDGTSTGSSDEVEVTVTTGNIAPVANAGPDQQVTTGQLVTLTGAGSTDANNDPLTYSWRFQSKPSKSTATLTGVTTVSPTFTPDITGFYVLSLIVNDGHITSTLDTVVIEARPALVNLVFEAYVKASNTEALDFFQSAAISGDTLAVAASTEDSCAVGINGDQTNNGCNNAGAVYVFTRSGGVWSQQAYLKASNTGANDSFGSSVALDGNTLAVAAFTESSCATGINGDQTDNTCPSAGAVYIFTRANGVWNQQAYVKASNTQADDKFGSSLALNGDTLAVGAVGEASCAIAINGNQTNNGCPIAGAVYTFTRTAGIWSQQAYVKASTVEAIDNFGGNVALSGDTLAVGAVGEDSCATGINGDQTNNGCPIAGAVYIFTRTAGIWSQQAYVKASNTEADDFFGTSLALTGDTLAVGAHHEASCATGINGDQANNGCRAAGAVYIFTRANGVWNQQAYVKASNTGPGDPALGNDTFGSSVALNGDTLAVGAGNESSCATGINGDQSNNSCPSAGAAYVFSRTNGIWSQQTYVKASNTERLDLFGLFVALSDDTLVVSSPKEASCATGINGDQANNGCPDAGAVYVYVGQ